MQLPLQLSASPAASTPSASSQPSQLPGLLLPCQPPQQLPASPAASNPAAAGVRIPCQLPVHLEEQLPQQLPESRSASASGWLDESACSQLPCQLPAHPEKQSSKLSTNAIIPPPDPLPNGLKTADYKLGDAAGALALGISTTQLAAQALSGHPHVQPHNPTSPPCSNSCIHTEDVTSVYGRARHALQQFNPDQQSNTDLPGLAESAPCNPHTFTFMKGEGRCSSLAGNLQAGITAAGNDPPRDMSGQVRSLETHSDNHTQAGAAFGDSTQHAILSGQHALQQLNLNQQIEMGSPGPATSGSCNPGNSFDHAPASVQVQPAEASDRLNSLNPVPTLKSANTSSHHAAYLPDEAAGARCDSADLGGSRSEGATSSREAIPQSAGGQTQAETSAALPPFGSVHEGLVPWLGGLPSTGIGLEMAALTEFQADMTAADLTGVETSPGFGEDETRSSMIDEDASRLDTLRAAFRRQYGDLLRQLLSSLLTRKRVVKAAMQVQHIRRAHPPPPPPSFPLSPAPCSLVEVKDGCNTMMAHIASKCVDLTKVLLLPPPPPPQPLPFPSVFCASLYRVRPFTLHSTFLSDSRPVHFKTNSKAACCRAYMHCCHCCWASHPQTTNWTHDQNMMQGAAAAADRTQSAVHYLHDESDIQPYD